MALSNGSFVLPGIPDLSKEVESRLVTILAGAGVAQVVNPAVPMEGVTVYNYSGNWIRGVITLSAGIAAVGTAATRAFLVPPQASYSVDFADDGNAGSAVGAIGAIDSISVAPVATPIAAGVVEASTLALSAAAVAGFVAFNFTTS